MKLHKLTGSIAILLFGMLVSWAAQALTVRITPVDGSNQPTGDTITLTSEAAVVNLDLDSPVGGARQYGPSIAIARCQGCAGRARVFVQEGTISKLVLTDAQ